MAVASTIISLMAVSLAFWAFLRTVFQEIPTVEFLVEPGAANGTFCYKLSVSNPTRRLIVLDHIYVLSPNTVKVLAGREESVKRSLTLRFDELSQSDRQRKMVYLAIPAGQTKCLDIEFGDYKDNEGFDVHFKLEWSKGLPSLDKCLMQRQIKLDSEQVKSRKMAVVG